MAAKSEPGVTRTAAKGKQPKQHRYYVFTQNNPAEGDLDAIVSHKYLQYVVYKLEKGESGTEHYQGYVQFTRAVPFSTVQRALPRAHIEVQKGTNEQARKYVYKSETTIGPINEVGTFRGTLGEQGQRTDIIGIKRRIDEGESVRTIMEDAHHFQNFAKHKAFFETYQGYKRRRTAYQPPEVYVFHGPTGANKTRTAFEILGTEDTYVWTPNKATSSSRWFCGYNGQPNVIFDEFRGQIPYAELLYLTDGYANMEVAIKGGHVYWSPKRIIFTSPHEPIDWYPRQNQKDSINQLMRRITKVIDFGKDDYEDQLFGMLDHKPDTEDQQNGPHPWDPYFDEGVDYEDPHPSE